MRSFALRNGKAFFLVIGLLISTIACSADKPHNNKETVLFDFETEDELGRLHWECGTFMEPDAQHATSGHYSLRVEMYPNGEYPGFKAGFDQGWQKYKRLSADIYNPSAEDVKISFRIDDRDGNPPFADRANGEIVLRPGGNILSMDLENLKTSGTERNLNLRGVRCLELFVHRPPQKLVLYVDRVRLAR